MPIYPAAMTALRPMTVPTRWQPARVVAAVLCFAALVLVLASVFLPLYSGEIHAEGDFSPVRRVEITYSAWSVETSPRQPISSVIQIAKVGYPLVFAAVLLAGAGCACWYAATPAAGRGAGRVAGSLMTAGVAFLVGTVWTTAVVVGGGVDYFDSLSDVGPGVDVVGSYLIGYWLLLVAVLLGAAAAVLSLLPGRQPAWQPPPPPVSPYLPTPPYGIAMPPQGQAVVHALPPEPPPGATVDPLTGQPHVDPLAGQPTGEPVAQPTLGIDPVTGQASPPSGLPVQPSAGAVDPLTGQPLAPGLLGPVPFTPEPVGQVNGSHPAPAGQAAAAEPPPIVVPDAPPPPEKPPGPAIPPTEDPLAEPPAP